MGILIITSISFSRCIRLQNAMLPSEAARHSRWPIQVKSWNQNHSWLVCTLFGYWKHANVVVGTLDWLCLLWLVRAIIVYLELVYRDAHSPPQRPRTFLSAPRIATSEKNQHQKSAIHGLPVTLRMLGAKSDKSDWLRIRNDYSTHAPKITFPRSWFLVLSKWSAASGNENDRCPDPLYHE